MLSGRKKKRDIFRASSYVHICTFTLFIVKCTHCPAIPVAREEEEEEIRKEEKRENVNYISMKVYRIKNGRVCEPISPLIR